MPQTLDTVADRSARSSADVAVTAPVVAPYEASHHADVLDLYKRFFGPYGAQRFAQRFAWQFADNPFASDAESTKPILVATSSGRVIGLFTAFPLPLRTPNGVATLHCSGDLVAEPGHPFLPVAMMKAMREQGDQIGTGASPEAERVGRLLGEIIVPLSNKQFTFPLRSVGATRRALRRNLPPWLRWAAGKPTARLVSAIKKPKGSLPAKTVPATEHSGTVVPLHGYGDDYDELWQAFSARFRFCIERGQTYMNWRYRSIPAESIECLALRGLGERLDGVAVLGVRTVNDDALTPCGTNGEILELIVRDPDDATAVRTLVAAAIRRLDSQRVDSVTATGLCAAYHPVLTDLGFEMTTNSLFRLGLMLDDKTLHEPLRDEDGWYLSAGDGDQLYGSVL